MVTLRHLLWICNFVLASYIQENNLPQRWKQYVQQMKISASKGLEYIFIFDQHLSVHPQFFIPEEVALWYTIEQEFIISHVVWYSLSDIHMIHRDAVQTGITIIIIDCTWSMIKDQNIYTLHETLWLWVWINFIQLDQAFRERKELLPSLNYLQIWAIRLSQLSGLHQPAEQQIINRAATSPYLYLLLLNTLNLLSLQD